LKFLILYPNQNLALAKGASHLGRCEPWPTIITLE
jgi:hypothetical protein